MSGSTPRARPRPGQRAQGTGLPTSRLALGSGAIDTRWPWSSAPCAHAEASCLVLRRDISCSPIPPTPTPHPSPPLPPKQAPATSSTHPCPRVGGRFRLTSEGAELLRSRPAAWGSLVSASEGLSLTPQQFREKSSWPAPPACLLPTPTQGLWGGRGLRFGFGSKGKVGTGEQWRQPTQLPSYSQQEKFNFRFLRISDTENSCKNRTNSAAGFSQIRRLTFILPSICLLLPSALSPSPPPPAPPPAPLISAPRESSHRHRWRLRRTHR